MPWLVKIVLGFAGMINFCAVHVAFVVIVFPCISDLRLGQQAQTVAMDFEKVQYTELL